MTDDIRATIRESNETLRATVQAGFESLQEELRMSREQGHIPVSVLEKILEQNYKAYASMAAHTDATNKHVMKTLCYLTTGLLVWVTGMKYFFPDHLPSAVDSVMASEP